MNDIINKYSEEDYLDELSPSLKAAIFELEAFGLSIEQIAEQMSKNPSFGLAAKGAEKWDGALFDRIRNELREIILTDNEKYKELREKLRKEGQVSLNAIIALISGFVGQNIGVSAAVCVPFVVLAIVAILRAGLVVVLNGDKDKSKVD